MNDKYKQYLVEWFQSKTKSNDLDCYDNYMNLGYIDSLEIILLIEEIETKFKISFDQNDFQNRKFSTINGLAELISSKALMND
tara:strand:+ start:1454 stop:1702 length:249 start_codon:yes stop_codon:yes gene_type:complete